MIPVKTTMKTIHQIYGSSSGIGKLTASPPLDSALKDSLFQDATRAHCRGSLQIQNRSLWQGGMIVIRTIGAIWYIYIYYCIYIYIYLYIKIIVTYYIFQDFPITHKILSVYHLQNWKHTATTTTKPTEKTKKNMKDVDFGAGPAGGHQLMADWWELVLEPNWIGKALHPEQGRELLGLCWIFFGQISSRPKTRPKTPQMVV